MRDGLLTTELPLPKLQLNINLDQVASDPEHVNFREGLSRYWLTAVHRLDMPRSIFEPVMVAVLYANTHVTWQLPRDFSLANCFSKSSSFPTNKYMENVILFCNSTYVLTSECIMRYNTPAYT